MPDTLPQRIGAFARRAFCRRLVARNLELSVSGLERVPRDGPVIVAARHYHHLYDGVVLIATLPRQVHILVARDWATGALVGRVMDALNRAARWPSVWRSPPAVDVGALPDGRRNASYMQARSPALDRQRAALAMSLALLAEGRLLVVFPEGYPSIDPAGSRKPTSETFLPFDSGFATLALQSARATGVPVPIVPAGFHYRPLPRGRWAVRLHLGAPRFIRERTEREVFVRSVEQEVRTLSR